MADAGQAAVADVGPAAVAAVDWGTSHMRLWLLDGQGRVLGERRSADGVLVAAEKGFERLLEEHLAELGAAPDLPVIICGMAGSRQGWTEARYVDVPAVLGTITDNAVRVPGVSRDVRILPGIAQRDPAAPEVMRGEETQLLGALEPGAGQALACMPGSHSKWVRVEKGAVASFATFLTGELYAAIGQHTILSQALEEGGFEASAGGAFGKAVRGVLDHPAGFSNRLFSIRSGQLLGYVEREDGAAQLSGCLIGSELAGARSFWSGASRVTLIAGPALSGPYATALGIAGLDVDLVDSEEAVRRGLFAAARAIWPLHEAITEAE